MAYDEELADRFRTALADRGIITEQRMMGGICFMVNGNMIGGADRTKDGERRFMFRVGKENAPEALERAGAYPMEMNGRRMHGFIFVRHDECDDTAFGEWVDMAFTFANSLPPKVRKK